MLQDKKSEAFGRAGRYYMHNGVWEQASRELQVSWDKESLVRAIEQAGQQILQQGRFKTLEGWLSIIDESELSRNPSLIMLKGELLSYGGLFAEAEGWIDKAFYIFKESGDMDRLARAAIHKARIVRYMKSLVKA